MSGPRASGLRVGLLALMLLGVVLGILWGVRRSKPPAPPAPTAALPSAPRTPEPSAVVAPTASVPSLAPPPPEVRFPDLDSSELAARNQALLQRMQAELALDDAALLRLKEVFEASRWLGQGNPEVTEHPMTRAECRERRAQAGELPSGDTRCKSPNMVPLYDPSAGETADNAKVCIDQYEFPNLPCEYPVVWVKANQTVELCRAMGKRICDAHEWEGACAGALKTPEVEYPFGERRMMMEYLHNQKRELIWSYGKTKDHAKCATMSHKSKRCDTIAWQLCGSNTYPTGAFPDCRSPLGAFDLNGNAAEHMNLPIRPEELGSRGGLGETEMKGSWFIFSTYEAHPDDCRWRAPMWHKSRMDDSNSHRNYHLSFRCCRDL